jgi:hypothetical protein
VYDHKARCGDVRDGIIARFEGSLFQRKFSGNVRRLGEWFDAPNFSLYILHQTYDRGLVDDVMGRLIWAHNLRRPRLDFVEK